MPDKVPQLIQTETQSSIQLVYYQQQMSVYPITEEQLDQLSSGETAIHLNFFMFVFGIFVTLIVTLTTVNNMSDRMFSIYVACAVGFFLMSLYFGKRAWSDWRLSKKKLSLIKNRSVPLTR